VTFRISLDSSIFISHLTDDVHAEAVLTALTVLETMHAELTLPLLCYAELWTGVELLPEEERSAAPALEVLTPQAFLARYAPAPRPDDEPA